MHDEGRSFRGTGTFRRVRVTWIVKGLASRVVRNNLPKHVPLHHFCLLVPCEMGQASVIKPKLMERKRGPRVHKAKGGGCGAKQGLQTSSLCFLYLTEQD